MMEAKTVHPFRQPAVQKWLATGLLLRFILMPLATHSDLLSIYQRAHLILGGHPEGPDMNLLNALHAGFLWLIRPLIPYQSLWGGLQETSLAASEWLGFINSTAVFRTLFLMKVPYLAFELLALWALLSLVEPAKTSRTTAFWMLNPVVIFSTYIFGRFDIIIVWLILSALLLAKRERPHLAVLTLGLAALIRVFPIILVLPFAFILKERWTDRLRLAAIGGVPLFASMAIGTSSVQFGIVRDFGGMQHLEYPLAMKFFLYGQDNLYIFVFLYSLIIMYLYLHPRLGFENLKRFCFYVMLTFFATSFFHPHYLIWLVPFIAFYIDVPRLLPLHGVQVSGWIIYTFQWGRSLAGYLIASISPAFFWAIVSPAEWIGQYYPSDQFVGLGRSLFSAVCLAMVYLVWRQYGGALDISPGRTRREAAETAAEERGA